MTIDVAPRDSRKQVRARRRPWKELLDDYRHHEGISVPKDRPPKGVGDWLDRCLVKAREAVSRDEENALKSLDLQYQVVADILALAEAIRSNRQKKAFRDWLNAHSLGSTTKASDAFSLAAKLAAHEASVDKKWVSKRASAARRLCRLGVNPSRAVEYLRNNGGVRGVLARQSRSAESQLDTEASWRVLEKQVSITLLNERRLTQGRKVLIAKVDGGNVALLRIVEGAVADRFVRSVANARPGSVKRGKPSTSRRIKKSRPRIEDW